MPTDTWCQFSYRTCFKQTLLTLLKLKRRDQNQFLRESLSPARNSYALGSFPLMVAVKRANSDWRMLNLALFAVVFTFTLAQWYDQGGWARIKLMLFPLLFFLVAIPWPLATDLQLTQWSERISSLIVDILLLLEHEARLEGTVIDIGMFGQIRWIACSGITDYKPLRW